MYRTHHHPQCQADARGLRCARACHGLLIGSRSGREQGALALAQVAIRADDATVDELVEHYRALMGDHEDWDAYRDAMAAERRTVVRFRPSRA